MNRGGLIFCFGRGRLGNQLFQYPAMRMFAPDARIVAVDMDDLRCGFEGVTLSRLSFSTKGKRGLLWRKFKGYCLWRAMRVTAWMRLVSVVDEQESVDGPHFKVTPGLFRRVFYFRSGWFQCESVADSPCGLGLRLNHECHGVAKRKLAALPGRLSDRYFVHVRRGDYITFPSPEHPAVLSCAWYEEQMSRVRERNPNAVFIVTSDDKPYIEEFFGGMPGVFIVHLGVLEDFAVMAGCLGGGILSASTFAWWAACLARRESADAYFIAPRYWFGHGTQTWMPRGIETSWIEYVDVARPYSIAEI